jgi:hypothetical protein
MRYVLRVVRFLTLSLLVLLLVGCGKGYKLAPVSGRVTMDNQPLANAEVSFYPTGGKGLPYASGTTDEQGNYKLEAFEGRGTANGAVVGEHRVEISMSNKTRGKKADPRSGVGPGGDLIPAQFNSDSKLTFTVPPAGTKEANFNLNSK